MLTNEPYCKVLPFFVTIHCHSLLYIYLFWSLTNPNLNYCHYFDKITLCVPQTRHVAVLFELGNLTLTDTVSVCWVLNVPQKIIHHVLTTKAPVFAVTNCSCKWKISWIWRKRVSGQLSMVQFLSWMRSVTGLALVRFISSFCSAGLFG